MLTNILHFLGIEVLFFTMEDQREQVEDQSTSLRIELSNVEDQRGQVEDQSTPLRIELSNVEDQRKQVEDQITPLRTWLSRIVVFFWPELTLYEWDEISIWLIS